MKFRSWWLGGAVLIVTIGLGIVMLFSGDGKSGKEDSPGTAKESRREVGKSTTQKRPAKKSPERSRPASDMPLVSRIVQSGNLPTLTDEQAERYLADSRRSAEALLAVFRMKGNAELLREAAKSFPNHPMVQLEMAMKGGTQEEKQQALDAFRKLKPDNALGDYLSALTHFQQGHPDEALEEIALAESHPGFGLALDDQVQGSEDAFLSAGFSLMEAKSAAVLSQPRTQTMAINQLANSLSGLYVQRTQEGDTSSADAVLELGLSLSRRLRDESRLLIDNLVAMSIETRLLRQLPPETTVPGIGQTAAQRLEALTAERSEVSGMTTDSVEALSKMSESEILSYFKRVTKEGEFKALQWLKENQSR